MSVEKENVKTLSVGEFQEALREEFFPPGTVYTEFAASPYDQDKDPKDWASVLGPPSPENQKFIPVISLRTFLAGRRHDPILITTTGLGANQYYKYLLDIGFLLGEPRLLELSNEDFLNPESLIKKVVESGGKRIIPYMWRRKLVELFRQYGLEVPIGEDGISIIEHVNNKTYFRDWYEENVEKLPYPRLTVYPGMEGVPEKISAFISESEEKGFISENPDEYKPAAFVQLSDSGGGAGNYIVYKKNDKFYLYDRKQQTYEKIELHRWVKQLADENKQPIEVTPFLKVLYTTTTGFAVTKDGIFVRQEIPMQLIDPETSAYRGFEFGLHSDNEMSDELKKRMLEAAKQLAQLLYKRGYFGWADLDFHVIILPDGTSTVAPSEVNGRWDGTTQSMRAIQQASPKTVKEILKGNLALLETDHFHVEVNSLEEVLAILRMKGVPSIDFKSEDILRGALLKGVPVNGEVGITLIGTPEEVKQWADALGIQVHRGAIDHPNNIDEIIE